MPFTRSNIRYFVSGVVAALAVSIPAAAYYNSQQSANLTTQVESLKTQIEGHKSDKDRLNSDNDKLEKTITTMKEENSAKTDNPSKLVRGDTLFDGYSIYTTFDKASDNKDVGVGLVLSPITKDLLSQSGNQPLFLEIILTKPKGREVVLTLKDSIPNRSFKKTLKEEDGFYNRSSNEFCFPISIAGNLNGVQVQKIQEIVLEQQNIPFGTERDFIFKSANFTKMLTPICQK